jgi:hypothetical protein
MTDCPKDILLAIRSPHHGLTIRKQQLTSQVQVSAGGPGRAAPQAHPISRATT